MSKPTSKLGQIFARLKTRLFKKKNSTEEWDEEDYEEVYEDEYDEDYEDEEFSDVTDPSFQTLTVTDIKKNNGDPPDLPPVELDDDEEDYVIEDEIDNTRPSFREFNVGKKVKSKLPQLGSYLSQINTDAFFEGLFSPQNRPKVHRIFIATLFAGSSYLGGRLVTNILTPAPNSKKVTKAKRNYVDNSLRSSIASIRKNDLFQAPERDNRPVTPIQKDKPKFKEVDICREASKASSLSIKLLSTVVLQDQVKSIASVQSRGKGKYLRVGDQIPNMIEVGYISPSKVVFKNLKSRQCEFIQKKGKKDRRKKPLNIVRSKKKARKIINDSKFTGIKNVGNQFTIKKEVRQQILSNISEVLTQAKAVQIKNPDGSLSFRMQEIVPGSVYSKLNIQENDIISSINGKKITSMNELMSLFGQIDKLDHFDIGFKREGIDQNQEYNFE